MNNENSPPNKIKLPKFTKGTFGATLTRRVNEYFVNNNITKHGDWRLYSKTIILFSLLFSAYSTMLFHPPQTAIDSIIFYGCFIIMGVAAAGIGFNVMHDASHKSYSRNAKLNAFITFMGGDFIGASTFMWNIKHNILHHTYTNIEGLDDDIAKYPLFRFSPDQKKHWWHRFQSFYALPLYSVSTLNWILINDYIKLVSKKIPPQELHITPKDHLMFFVGKVINISFFIILPTIIVGWQVLLGFVLMHVVIGTILAIIFQLAHVVENTDFVGHHNIIENNNNISDEFMIHQIKTTTNFAMHKKALSWYIGGLNYQVEHHLFSNISHIHYPAISKIVQTVCKEHNITYNAFPTFREAVVSHFSHLHKMGKVA